MKPSSDLFHLIKSLDKNEKRYFRLTSSAQNLEKNYLKLFDAIDHQTEYDEDELKIFFKDKVFIQHLPSEKNHLYKLILKSLRQYYSENNISVVLSELFQNIEILYKKALFTECSKLIIKAKRTALNFYRFDFVFEAIKWEKILLEKNKNKKRFEQDLQTLEIEQLKVIDQLKNTAEYQALSKKINFIFSKSGFNRSFLDNQLLDDFANLNLIKHESAALSDFANARRLYIKGAISLMKGNIETAFKEFVLLEQFFNEKPNLIAVLPKYYIKSLINQFYYFISNQDYEAVFSLIKKIQIIESKEQFAQKELNLKVFLSLTYFELIALRLRGDFDNTPPRISQIRLEIDNLEDVELKEDRILFDYQFAIIHFAKGEYKDSLRLLEKIPNQTDFSFRQDILNASKIMAIVVHYEMANFDLLDFLIKQADKYFAGLKKESDEFIFETTFLKYIKMLVKINQAKESSALLFGNLNAELSEIIKAKRYFQIAEYFDLNNWSATKASLELQTNQ